MPGISRLRYARLQAAMTELEPEIEETPPKKNREHYLMLGCFFSMFLFPCVMFTPIASMIRDWGAGGFVKKVDAVCKERLPKLHKAVELYAADYDETYPIADQWVDLTATYGAKKDPEDESESIFRCAEISMTRTGDYGYAFNAVLSSVKRSSVSDPDGTPMIFDSSNLKRNASGKPEDLLPKPARHNREKNNNAVMVSGKVKEMP